MPEHEIWVPTNAFGSSTCNGPLGLPIILPLTLPTGTMLSSMNGPYIHHSVTSLCNGSSMYNLWCWQNSIIQTNSIDPPTGESWVYLATPPSVTETYLGTSLYLQGVLFTPPKPRPRVLPAVIRAGRRAVRRSIDMYARFRGMDEIRRFIRGEEIVIEGELYNYRIKKTVRVIEQTMRPGGGHIPYSLHIVDKSTDKSLAKGCVLIPTLPVIDQILALSFHVQDSKDERDLIRTTNWNPPLSRRLLEAA